MSITNDPIDHPLRIKALIRTFEAAQERWKEYGAADTEPDGIWQGLVRDAIFGRTPKIPETADEWDLFDQEPGAEAAAAALAAAARAAVEAIGGLPLAAVGPIRDSLRGYCWRVAYH
jgi:hypothetical protein